MRLPPLSATAWLAAALLVAAAAHAQTFPTKPIRVINPASPGGNSDIFFRLLQPKMKIGRASCRERVC